MPGALRAEAWEPASPNEGSAVALPVDLRIPPNRFPEKVARFVEDGAPTPMKLMAARGLVPMPPVVQICVLHNFAHDPDPELVRAAVDTVQKLPRRTVHQAAGERLLPAVLDWLARAFADDPTLVRGVVQNGQTDEDTLVRLAKTADEALCDLLAQNETRVLASPRLVEALYFNRRLRASTCDRMIDLCVRNGVDLSNIPGHEEIVAAIQGVKLPSSAAEAAAQDAAFKAVAEAAAHAPPPAEVDPDAGGLDEDEADGAEAAPVDEERKSSAGRIRDMNVAQRVRLANLGSAAERMILIQDTNKIVTRAVIRSPAVSDQEAMAYAKNKALPDEVILFISKQKRWTRHYQMRLNLISHPKCPIADALTYLRTLRAGDLRAVARSKNVSPTVAKAAKDLIKVRLK